jgi:hypothetical protein
MTTVANNWLQPLAALSLDQAEEFQKALDGFLSAL